MSVSVTSPATLLEVAEFCSGRGWEYWRLARHLWEGGDTFVLRANGDAIGLAGFFPLPAAGQAEAWFNFRPEAAPHMLGVVRAVRLTLQSAPYRDIVTIVTSPAGARIAKASGFTLAAKHNLGEVWQCQNFGTPSPERHSGAP